MLLAPLFTMLYAGCSLEGDPVVVTYRSGDAVVVPAGDTRRPAMEGMILLEGEALRTGTGSRAALQVGDVSVMLMGPVTVLRRDVARAAADSRFSLTEGTLAARVPRGPVERRFIIRTPAAEIVLRGDSASFSATVHRDRTVVAVGDGVLSVARADGRQVTIVFEGRAIEAADTHVTRPLTDAERSAIVQTGAVRPVKNPAAAGPALVRRRPEIERRLSAGVPVQ